MLLKECLLAMIVFFFLFFPTLDEVGRLQNMVSASAAVLSGEWESGGGLLDDQLLPRPARHLQLRGRGHVDNGEPVVLAGLLRPDTEGVGALSGSNSEQGMGPPAKTW